MAQASDFYARNPYVKNLRLRVNSGSNYASGKRVSLADYLNKALNRDQENALK
jgi:hypothetical protein